MRETPGVSVWPTVSDSMLKARRRNNDATRFRTPGLLSTYTANVCIFLGLAPRLLVLRRLDNRRRPANHLVQVGSGRHHRVDGVFLLDAEIDQRAALATCGGD